MIVPVSRESDHRALADVVFPPLLSGMKIEIVPFSLPLFLTHIHTHTLSSFLFFSFLSLPPPPSAPRSEDAIMRANPLSAEMNLRFLRARPDSID